MKNGNPDPRILPINANVTRRFVEMLESHHSLVVKALQKLYKFCINNEGFPGDALAEAPDGHPLTHAILDRLGLIKQAEENADEPDEDSEDLRYLRLLSTSTECSVTAEPSPEPATPPEPSPTLSRPARPIPTPTVPGSSTSVSTNTSTSTSASTSWQWDLRPVQTSYSYPDGYHDLMMQRSMNAPDIGEITHVDLANVPSGLPHHQTHPEPFSYVLDGCCAGSGQDVKPVIARLPPGLMESHAHQHMTGTLPAEMMGEFHFPQDSVFYAGFTPGWSFPST